MANAFWERGDIGALRTITLSDAPWLVEACHKASEALSRVEWAGVDADGRKVCADCLCTEDEGHAESCSVGAALEHLRGR